MPQFDPANFPPQIAWLVVLFAILYFGVIRTTLPRLGRVVGEREAVVKGDLDAAHHAKAEADGTRALYESAMVKARHDAQAMVTESQAAVQRRIEERLHATDAEIGRKLDEAVASIESGRRSAAGEIERAAGSAAADIVEQLTGTRPGEAAVADALAGTRGA